MKKTKLADDPYSSEINKNEEIENLDKPIKPIIVSRGLWGQRCRGGFCHFQKNIKEQPCPALKVTDPCGPRPQWLEWAEESNLCSVSCGNGNIKLKRYCSSGKNKDCIGEETKIRECIMPSCIYQWKDWTEWTKCSVSCGGNGKRMRYRTCKSDDNKCIGHSSDLRPCGEQPCPSWTNWSEWGHCSLMLTNNNCNGNGIQQRKRDCINILNKNEEKEIIECDGLAFEQRNCQSLKNKNCPIWSNWGEWSNCSKKCGNGEKIRYRKCEIIDKNEEENYLENCKGPAIEHLLCNTNKCSPEWAEWNEWSECSSNCGNNGHQFRSRECFPSGNNCTGGVKAGNDFRICQNNKTFCYYFDQWTEWSGCSVTCGKGFCERQRKCLKNNNKKKEENSNLNQSFNKEEEEEIFPTIPAEKISLNYQTQLNNENNYDRILIPGLLFPQKLKVFQSLTVNNNNKRKRSPLISSKLILEEIWNDELKLNNNKCNESLIERKICYSGPCCEWNIWSEWSNCQINCNKKIKNEGFRQRTRNCIFPSKNNIKNIKCLNCIGEWKQKENCLTISNCNLNKNDLIIQEQKIEKNKNLINQKNSLIFKNFQLIPKERGK